MSKRIAFFAVGLSCFGLGYLTAEFGQGITSQPKESVLRPISTTQQNSDVAGWMDISFDSNSDQSLAENQAIAKQQLTQIHQVIAQAPSEKIDQYLARAFPNANLQNIRDRKKLAQRLIDEFVEDKNTNQGDLKGQVIVTAQERSPIQASDIENIYPQQQLFAHLDTLNSIQNTEQVFIRWIHRDTGEVLLFTPQNVSSQSSKNWISFTPPQGWKVGVYDVRYYQMNDDLNPVAQTSFNIRSVQY